MSQANVELATRKFLGLGDEAPACVQIRQDSRLGSFRVTVKYRLDERDDLVVEVFPSRPGSRTWMAGPRLSVSYRLLADGADPFEHAAGRRVLGRIRDAVSRRPDGDEATDLLEALARARPEPEPASSPERWRGIFAAYQDSALSGAESALLHAAIEIGLVRHLSAVASASVSDIAEACGCRTEAMAVFLRALATLGFVQPCEEDRGYRLAPGASSLLGPAEPLLRLNRAVRDLLDGRLVEALRAGRLHGAQAEMWTTMIESLGFMEQTRDSDAYWNEIGDRVGLWGARRLLDVGAGSGHAAAAFLDRDPALRVVAVDYAPALPTARACLGRRGLLGRVTLIEGDFYDPSWHPPEGCDAAWLANTMHTAGPDENRSLFGKIHGALPAGGKIVVVEKARDLPDRSVAMDDVVWSLFTERGRAYSMREVTDLIEGAGFGGVRASAWGEGIGHFVATKGGERA